MDKGIIFSGCMWWNNSPFFWVLLIRIVYPFYESFMDNAHHIFMVGF